MEQNHSNQTKISTADQRKKSFIVMKTFLSGLKIGLLLSALTIIFSSSLREMGWMAMYFFSNRNEQNQISDPKLKKELQRLEKRISDLKHKLDWSAPRKPYLIIDTSENRFSLKTGKKLIYKGICSTGSYTMLKTVDDLEEWIFKTPRGMFRVRNIIQKPVWRMPDWAFIEEGLPVPPPESPERFEFGVLGDYGLDIGNGYLIHGTLYQRFLGLPVTHGCVRLGDKELQTVYNHLSLGSKVYIY